MQQNNSEFEEVSTVAYYGNFLFFMAINNASHIAIAYIEIEYYIKLN